MHVDIQTKETEELVMICVVCEEKIRPGENERECSVCGETLCSHCAISGARCRACGGEERLEENKEALQKFKGYGLATDVDIEYCLANLESDIIRTFLSHVCHESSGGVGFSGVTRIAFEAVRLEMAEASESEILSNMMHVWVVDHVYLSHGGVQFQERKMIRLMVDGPDVVPWIEKMLPILIRTDADHEWMERYVCPISQDDPPYVRKIYRHKLGRPVEVYPHFVGGGENA